MKKIINLCINETIKLFKKKSTIAIILFAILSLFAAAGFAKLSQENTKNSRNNDYMVENIKYEIEALKNATETQGKGYDSRARLEMLQYAYENKINIYNDNWKTEIINKLIDKKTNEYKMKDTAVSSNEELNKLKNEIDNLFNILKQERFDEYIDLKIADIKKSYDTGNITKEEYEEQVEIQNLTKKYEVGKTSDQSQAWKKEVLSEISTIKSSLRLGIDMNSRQLLSYDNISKLNDKLKIDMYRLENNIQISSNIYGDFNYRSLYESMAEKLSMMFIGILVIISAGSSISSEISKGTIKFLIMTPNKRWKILLSKIIVYTVVLLIFTLVISICGLIVGNIFFSDLQAIPYLYIKDGNVNSISHNVYEILRFFTYDIDIFMYILLATLISVITRNTSLAISLSMAAYIGASTVMQIINAFIQSEWIKFVPFNNLNLTEKFFANENTSMSTEIFSQSLQSVTLTFSMCVLAVSAIIMIVSMFDSFNKKDIV